MRRVEEWKERENLRRLYRIGMFEWKGKAENKGRFKTNRRGRNKNSEKK